MKLNLKRPIAFFDIEATGLDKEKDRIVEISIVKLFPDGSRESKTRYINPGMPIPEKSTKIHGITNEMVADSPTFGKIAKSLYSTLEGCDIGGYNSNHFDIPMLYFHFQREGIDWDYHSFLKIDAGIIFKRKEERTLSAAVKFFCGREMDGAHTAEADTNETVNVFLAQLERYPDLPQSLEELELYCNYDRKFLDISGKFSFDEDGDVIFNFGPEKGNKAIENLGLVEWMLTKNFSPDTVKICYDILDGVYGRKTEQPEEYSRQDIPDSDLPF